MGKKMTQQDWAIAFADTEINKDKNPEEWKRTKRIFKEGWNRACMDLREHGWLPPSEIEKLVKEKKELKEEISDLKEDLANKESAPSWMNADDKIFTKEDARILLNGFQEYVEGKQIDPPYSFQTLVNYWIDHYISPNKQNIAMEETVGFYYDLFKFFADNHNLILVDSEIQDIIHAINAFEEKRKEQEYIDAHLEADVKFDVEEFNNDDDFEEESDPTCEACGYNHGNHMKGCPNDDSPFALLCRRGFD
jgi:hypothetical protein